MLRFSVLRLVAVFVLMAGLGACKSSDERAEEFFESAMELVEAGDLERALVQFRNVFELKGDHKEARRNLAETLEKLGQQGRVNSKYLRQAYSQYLRLAEQYPDDSETRIVLSEMAFRGRNWQEFERHSARAVQLDPDNPRSKAIQIGIDYRAASEGDDPAAMRDVARRAGELLTDLPDNGILRDLVVDSAMRNSDFDVALDNLDVFLEQYPTARTYHDQKLAILLQKQDFTGFEAQLKQMVDIFPEDKNLKGTLVRFYVSRERLDDAESFLREIVDIKSSEPGAIMDLVRFMQETQGAAAARAELEKIIAANPDPAPFRATLALMDFQEGKRDEAVATMEEILTDAQPSDQTRRIKIGLARMLLSLDNQVGARRLVEEVLAEDSINAEALKMNARWQIDSDDTDAAIAGLRVALDSEENDTQVMTLMAEAYVRTGNMDLARDFLAQAAEASGNAPQESIRYANFLIAEERFLPAENVLIPALRRSRGNIDLLQVLGQLYIRMEDEARARQVIDSLRRDGGERAISVADGLEVAFRNLSMGTDEALSYLEQLATEEDASVNAKVAVIRARLASGDAAGAKSLAEDFLKETPDSAVLRFALATSTAGSGDIDGAKAIYRALVEEDANRPTVWLELARIAQFQDGSEEGLKAIDEGLSHVPENGSLLWAKASYLERGGDVDGALEIYEAMYERASSSIVVANNLASLLSTYRDDEESLNRAYGIARRFRSAQIPAMQDTYGWIAFRRGEVEEALPHLEAAAAGLQSDPLVQYHLAKTYAALGRNEEALKQYRFAVEVAGPADTRKQIDDARAEIARLEAAPSGTGDEESGTDTGQ